MSCTTPALARRHGAVDRCFRDSRLLELSTAVFEPALEACLDGVDQRAGFAKLLWRERRQLLEELRKSSRFSAEQRRSEERRVGEEWRARAAKEPGLNKRRILEGDNTRQ